MLLVAEVFLEEEEEEEEEEDHKTCTEVQFLLLLRRIIGFPGIGRALLMETEVHSFPLETFPTSQVLHSLEASTSEYFR